MDVVLLTLTTLSLAAAAGFGALSWRVGREERERARARIAALSTAMAPPSAEAPLLAGVAVGSVFDRTTEGLRGRPAIKWAAGVAMLLLIAAGVFVTSRTSDPAGGSAKTHSGQGRPVEPKSVPEQRHGTALTVSGPVKKPTAW